jgi:hypothetical protein
MGYYTKMTSLRCFTFVVRQRNNPPYNETLNTNSCASVAKWMESRVNKEPKSKNPNKDFVLIINGRRYEWPRVWKNLEHHLEHCLELDTAFYN